MERSHVHHLVHREDGGDLDVDNLACLGPAWHLRHVHPKDGDGWRGRLDPASGIISWTRRDVHIERLPRGTPLAPPGDMSSARGHPPAAGGDPPAPDDRTDLPDDDSPLPF